MGMGPRMREDKRGGECGRFPNLHYEGLAAQHITGDHKGRPYEGRMGAGMGMGPRMREDKRGGVWGWTLGVWGGRC